MSVHHVLRRVTAVIAGQLSRNLIPFSVHEELLPLPASDGRCC